MKPSVGLILDTKLKFNEHLEDKIISAIESLVP